MLTCPCSPTRLQQRSLPVQVGLPLGALRTPRSRTQLVSQVVRAEKRVRRTTPSEIASPCEGQAAFWGLVPLLLRAQAASADEFAPEQQPPSLGIGEVLLLLAPILLYGVFSLYREKVNPKAKLSDFLFIAVAAVIVLNILSILILKVRLF